MQLNQTHDPNLTSWVESANAENTDFPIQNLPFAVLRRRNTGEAFRVAVAIGDFALDLLALHQAGLLPGGIPAACRDSTLNRFMALGCKAWSALRAKLSTLLSTSCGKRQAVEACLLPLKTVEFALPARIGDYTDFYTSIHHATNVGKLFRPDNPLMPNYEWLPVGYHGRASSVGVSGQRIVRPCGQLKAPDASQPVLAPCRKLDYELEVGIFLGTGNEPGEAIPLERAEDHIFGLCLLNDWSARDIQAWEYQPLGPFLAKSFATTISPWIVTLEALAPFRAPFVREAERPQPLPYLCAETNALAGVVDMQLEVQILTEAMRAAQSAPETLSSSNYSDAYWTMAQLVAHHTVNGCDLRPGDLFGSGTMSGSQHGTQGALLELTQGGASPLVLENGEQRQFLEDGDTVIMRGRCERAGYRGIGFGAVCGTVEPAPAPT